MLCVIRPLERVLAPPSLPERTDSKNMYTKSLRLALSCIGTGAWYEIVYLHNGQIRILPKNTRIFTTLTVPRAPSGPQVPGDFYRLPLSTVFSARIQSVFILQNATAILAHSPMNMVTCNSDARTVPKNVGAI